MNMSCYCNYWKQVANTFIFNEFFLYAITVYKFNITNAKNIFNAIPKYCHQFGGTSKLKETIVFFHSIKNECKMSCYVINSKFALHILLNKYTVYLDCFINVSVFFQFSIFSINLKYMFLYTFITSFFFSLLFLNGLI